MRREYISYSSGLPINISFKSIEQYPIHWHDTTEVVFVLEGSIEITIETESYVVEANEIEIINCNEAHWMKGLSKNNKVLIFHVEPSFFQHYYDDIKNVFFYTNSSVEGAQESEKYYVLRKYLSLLLCEFIQQKEGYKKILEKTLVDMLFHLINNFHQLIYDEESLKKDEVQFERYDRIVKYIYNNYMNKISLQEIAKMEYLSSNYLSNKIKDTMGYSFNDFLNLTRVEESIKLLLDTDKTISEISLEMGFSHTRYFNKHFKKHYKCTPMQFRKRHKVDGTKLVALKKFELLNIEEALQMLSSYIEDYDRYNFEDKIVKINIDTLSETKKLEKNFLKFINIGEAEKILYTENIKLLQCLQDSIEFNYCIITKLFCFNMDVFENKNRDFLDWSKVKNVLNFLLNINLKPVIVLDQSLEELTAPLEILESFIIYFSNTFNETLVGKWKFILSNNLDETLAINIQALLKKYFDSPFIDESIDIKKLPNPLYDTCYTIPYIIESSINNEGTFQCFSAFDVLNRDINLDNEICFGGTGLISNKGIKKPSYYAYYFLSLLGNEVIAKGNGYIATTKNEDIQILLYSNMDITNNFKNLCDINKIRSLKTLAEINYSLNILNLKQDYTIIKYNLNEKNGSFYNYWLDLSKPQRLNDEELSLIKEASLPKISFGFTKKSTVHNIVSKIQGCGATLIILKKYKNT